MGRMGRYREAEHYITTSVPGEQVTPMGDNWYVVHHTGIPNNHWWAVRHQCEDDEHIYGMVLAFPPGHTHCHGCKISLPKEIEGFIHLIEWKR